MTSRQLPAQAALIWHSYLLIGILGLLASAWFWPCAGLACLLLLIDQRLWQPQRLAISVLVFACAFAYSSQALASGRKITSQPGFSTIKDTRICGRIDAVLGLPENRLRVTLAEARTTAGLELPGLVIWTWEKPPFNPLPGQMACITRTIKPVRGYANYAENSYEDSFFARKMYWRLWSKADAGAPVISGQGSWLARLREKPRLAFLRTLWPSQRSEPMSQARAILPALVFGDRQYLDQSTVNNFAAASLAHSLALSGQHLGLAGILALAIVTIIGLLCPRFYLRRPRALLIVALSLPLALIYVWLGNGPASLLRALGMLVFAQFWLLRDRSFIGIDLLLATLAVILILNPLAIFDVGLQLSALCVGVILIFFPVLGRLLPKRKEGQSLLRRLGIGALQIIALSLAIQIALLPLTLTRFQIAGLWFPLNVLWLPALGLIVLPCAAVALGFCVVPIPFCQTIASLLLDLAALPCQLLLRLLDYLRQKQFLAEPAFMIPHTATLLAFAVLIGLLAWLFGRQGRLAPLKAKLLFTLALALFASGPCLRLIDALDSRIRIDALDAGQGQAILFSLPRGVRILIDGSGTFYNRFDPGKSIVAPALCQNASPALTAVINTHPDLDHLGGLFHILSTFSVSSLFHNGGEAQKGAQARWQEFQDQYGAHALASGDRIIIGPPQDGLTLEVLHPPADADLRGNRASLVLRLVRNGKGLALIPGDIDKAGLNALLERKPELDTKVVFAPHHGSDKNLLAAFYVASQPEVVAACCGFLNRWGYPGEKLAAMLHENGIPLFDTGRHGRISIAFDEMNRPHVETVRRP